MIRSNVITVAVHVVNARKVDSDLDLVMISSAQSRVGQATRDYSSAT